jgi:hypothetical protein
MIGPKGRECSNGRQTMALSPILMQSPLQTMWMRLTNVLINRQGSNRASGRRIPCSGRITANPEVAPKRGYFPIGHNTAPSG